MPGNRALDDKALAGAAAHGSERAVREILQRVTPKLRAIAWHMVYDHHECEDLCQEALLKLTSPSVLLGYRGQGPLDAYLMRVAVRTMISARRTRSTRQWKSFAPIDSADGPAPTHGTDGLRGLDPALRDALCALPERARVLVLLIAVGDFSYEEAAVETGLPVGTVKSAYSRARSALRRALATRPLEIPQTGVPS
jgi:RNA polymerase sigma-70 factor (ECF subfamily)